MTDPTEDEVYAALKTIAKAANGRHMTVRRAMEKLVGEEHPTILALMLHHFVKAFVQRFRKDVGGGSADGRVLDDDVELLNKVRLPLI